MRGGFANSRTSDVCIYLWFL